MSRRDVIELIDDLDDRVLPDGDGETVTFGLDGTEYEIDLSTKNAATLRPDLSHSSTPPATASARADHRLDSGHPCRHRR